MLGITLLFLCTKVSGLVNLALNKPANQTGVYGDLTADKAVDGLLGQQWNNDHCAQPYNGNGSLQWDDTLGGWVKPKAMWWVDLQDTYLIYNVTLHNTYIATGSSLLSHFVINVGNSLSELAQCDKELTATVPAGRSVTIACHRNGRFVQFSKTDGSDVHTAIICEVAVYGQLLNDCQMWYTGPSCTTYIGKPDYYNETLKTTEISNSSITIQWIPLHSIPATLSHYYKYKVKYKTLLDSEYKDGPTASHVSGGFITATISELDYNTQYNLTLVPYREMKGIADYGSSYPSLSTKTKCGDPEKLEDFDVLVLHSQEQDEIRITFGDVRNINSRCNMIVSMRVEYRLQGNQDWVSVSLNTSQTEYTFTPTQNGVYQVKISAFTDGGTSSTSDIKLVDIKENDVNNAENTEGLSPGLTTGIIVLAVLVVVAVTVIIVVVLILRHRRQTASRETGTVVREAQSPTVRYITKPGVQSNSDKDYEYATGFDTAPSTTSTYLHPDSQYIHLAKIHNEYSNEDITGPYEVIV